MYTSMQDYFEEIIYMFITIYIYEGIQKVLRQILKKNSEYGNQIESCKYSHLIWLPYSEFFFRICLKTF